MFAGAALMVGLLGCGGGTATFYKGTLTSTQSYNGASSTTTTTGQTLSVYSGGEQGAILVDLGNIVVSMTKAGDALTATANQSLMQTDSNSNSSQSISSGTGTLNAMGLTLNLSGTQSQTSNGQTANATFTLTFTGTKI
jgi:hypothetical protein